MTEKEKTAAGILRAPFPAEHVGKLPRVTCPKCSDRNNRSGKCDEHQKAKCPVCKAYVSERHIHIDYVGHADVTSRLLEADPEWEWRPLATDPDKDALAAAIASSDADLVRMVIENAPPKFDMDDRGNPVGLWILLTVGGMTRRGFGSVPSGQNDAVKVLIGDALRNAAMRFGVALDLWAKGDRADPAAENATASAGTAVRRQPRQASQRPAQNAPPRPAAVRAPAKAPEGAETDIDWMSHLVNDLIPGATTRAELLGFWDKVDEQVRDGKCTDQDAKDIRGLVTTRAEELGLERSAAA